MVPDPPTPPAPPQLPAELVTDWRTLELDPDFPDLDGIDATGDTVELPGARTLSILRSRLTDTVLDAPAETPLDLQDAVLVGVDLTGRRIETMRRVHLERCRLGGIDGGDARLADVTFAECAADLGSWRKATWERVVVDGGRIDGLDLTGTTATDVRVRGVALAGVTLDRFRAERVDLTDADLSGLQSLTELRGCSISPGQAIALAARLATTMGLHVVEEPDRDHDAP